MRILQANKFFYPVGGVEAVFFDTIKGLRARGHMVSEFSMQNKKNNPSDYSKYFVSEISTRLSGKFGVGESLKIATRFFYSSEVQTKLTSLVRDTKPEVAHLHNIYHHLSASTFTTLHKLKIPTVLTLHDYFPLVPNHNFLHKETVVENLFKHKTYNCVRYRCIQNKLLPSLVGTLEAYFYRLKRIWQHIDLFICPSNFMKDKMVEWGFPATKMRVAFNPFKEVAQPLLLGKKIVYIGRIHYEKGTKFLLEAAKSLKEYEFIIAGSGPDEMWVDNYIKENKLTNVTRYGWVEGEQWRSIMKQAKVVVLPTIVYENCSVNILEALSYGRLVVASNRGGNPEMIIDSKSGFLAQPEDTKDLVKKIRQAVELIPEETNRIIQYAQKNILPRYQLDVYLDALEKVYQELV